MHPPEHTGGRIEINWRRISTRAALRTPDRAATFRKRDATFGSHSSSKASASLFCLLEMRFRANSSRTAVLSKTTRGQLIDCPLRLRFVISARAILKSLADRLFPRGRQSNSRCSDWAIFQSGNAIRRARFRSSAPITSRDSSKPPTSVSACRRTIAPFGLTCAWRFQSEPNEMERKRFPWISPTSGEAHRSWCSVLRRSHTSSLSRRAIQSAHAGRRHVWQRQMSFPPQFPATP